jgi:hypothetical protein
MSIEVSATRNVRSRYGEYRKGAQIGHTKTEGGRNLLTVTLTGADLDDMATANGKYPFPQVVLPKGAVILKAYFRVTEAFVITGTTPVVDIGTSGSEATNGVTISETNLESIGADDVTAALAGTWAAGVALTAATDVGVAFSGGTTTSDPAVGKAFITVEYFQV